jgi:hypothetical protein
LPEDTVAHKAVIELQSSPTFAMENAVMQGATSFIQDVRPNRLVAVLNNAHALKGATVGHDSSSGAEFCQIFGKRYWFIEKKAEIFAILLVARKLCQICDI